MGNVPVKGDFYKVVEDICANDRRYKADAYEFVMQGLYFTQGRIKRQGHIKGKELADGLRDFAIDKFGVMAKTVLNHWGVSRTKDLGNIVFNMVERKLLSKTEEDSIRDFEDIYDFDEAFGNVLRDSVAKLKDS